MAHVTLSSPIRILHLVPEILPTHRVDVLALFGKYLPRHDVTCDVIGRSDDKPLTAQQGFASVRRVAQTGGRLRRELRFALTCLRAALGASPDRYDAVQVRDLVSTGLLVMLAARLRGIPFLFWMSFPMCEGRIVRARNSGWRGRIVLAKGLLEKWLLYRVVLPGARHVFVQSDAMGDMVAAQGIARDKITAVPMGVDTELIVQPEGTGSRREGVPQIAYLGTLDKLRRLDLVIDALRLVRERHPSAELLLIGGGEPSDAAALHEHAARLGLQDAVRITGWMPAPQAWGMLRAADAAISYIPRGIVFDVSSPTKILEYLALGMPSVANDIPDQVWVLRNSDAGWLTGSTVAELAAALCEILDDPEASRARAARGPAFIEATRSYRVLAEQLAGRYRQLVGKR